MPDRVELNSRAQIQRFVGLFYQKLLADEQLKPVFVDIAGIDLEQHLPRIVDYWCKLLLKEPGYDRHTMNIHRALHARRALGEADFQRWLMLFETTMAQHFCGANAEHAVQIARRIAANMQNALACTP
ncbi:MAG: globin [Gammaproteobacteria bacterium]|nr:MAG: globin [Gammaproteobacteria bacterium]